MLRSLENLAFGLDGRCDHEFGQVELADVVCADVSHAGFDCADEILRAVVQVRGAEVEVHIRGTASTVFGNLPGLGISGFDAYVISKARAATGVDAEW